MGLEGKEWDCDPIPTLLDAPAMGVIKYWLAMAWDLLRYSPQCDNAILCILVWPRFGKVQVGKDDVAEIGLGLTRIDLSSHYVRHSQREGERFKIRFTNVALKII